MTTLLRSDSDLQFQGFLDFPQMSFAAGDFSFLAGPSGSGKSTYLHLLNRTALPSRGEILFRDKPQQEYPVLDYRRKVLLAPQNVYLKDATIAENFQMFYRARGDAAPEDKVMREALELCLADFDPEDSTRTLSGGESQRVFLAIFLSSQPEVLLLDEPTAALDENTATTLLENLKGFTTTHDITVICVSHSENLIEKFSDHTVRLEERPDGNNPDSEDEDADVRNTSEPTATKEGPGDGVTEAAANGDEEARDDA